MKIILTGFMGSGKSTVAEILHYYLGLPFKDMDEVTVSLSGCTSVTEIFDTYGEEHFRNLEYQSAKELGALQEAIIASGGGVIEREETLQALRGKDGVVFYMQTSFDEIKKRLKGDFTRPLFKDLKGAERLYLKRLPRYEKFADYVIPTDGLSAREVAEKIVEIVKTR